MDQNQSDEIDLTAGFPLEELPEGGSVVGKVGDASVLLVRRGAEVFAVDALCTHYHGPLAEGLVVGDTVRCPWHPYSKGGTFDDIRTIFRELDYPVYAVSSAKEWVSTTAADSGIVIRPKPMPNGVVPSVIGMGARDAVSLLENAGLQVHLQGVGRVVSQSIQAGSKIRPGSTIFIRLE